MCLLCCWSVLRSNCLHLCFVLFLREQCHNPFRFSLFFFFRSAQQIFLNICSFTRCSFSPQFMVSLAGHLMLFMCVRPNNLFFKHGNNSFQCTKIGQWWDFLITYKSLLQIVIFLFCFRKRKNKKTMVIYFATWQRLNDKLNIQRPKICILLSSFCEKKKENIRLARVSFQRENMPKCCVREQKKNVTIYYRAWKQMCKLCAVWNLEKNIQLTVMIMIASEQLAAIKFKSIRNFGVRYKLWTALEQHK